MGCVEPIMLPGWVPVAHLGTVSLRPTSGVLAFKHGVARTCFCVCFQGRISRLSGCHELMPYSKLKALISGLLPPQVLLSHILHAESRVSDPLPPLMDCRWLDGAHGAKVKLAASVAHHSAGRLSTVRHSQH